MKDFILIWIFSLVVIYVAFMLVSRLNIWIIILLGSLFLALAVYKVINLDRRIENLEKELNNKEE